MGDAEKLQSKGDADKANQDDGATQEIVGQEEDGTKLDDRDNQEDGANQDPNTRVFGFGKGKKKDKSKTTETKIKKEFPEKSFLSSCRDPDLWSKLFPPESPDSEGLVFDPNTSNAICIGVGRQLNCSGDLGPAPEADAVEVRTMLANKLGIPYERMQLMTCDKPNDVPKPSKQEILSTVKKFAASVDSNGILFIHFSGHAVQMSDNAESASCCDGYIVPCDYQPSSKNYINCHDLVNIISDSKARAVVLILDCCMAASFAQDVCKAMSKKAEPIPVLAFAGCASTESSVNWPMREQPHGLFCYVLLNFLNQHAQPGRLPVRELSEHLGDIFQRLNTLHGPGFLTGATTMTPDVLVCAWNNFKTLEQAEPVKPLVVPTPLSSTAQRTLSVDEDQALQELLLDSLKDELREFQDESVSTEDLETKLGDWIRSAAEQCTGLEDLLQSKGFCYLVYSYAVFSMVSLLAETVALDQLRSPRLMYLLWENVCKSLPKLLHSKSPTLQDAQNLFNAYYQKLHKLELKELQKKHKCDLEGLKREHELELQELETEKAHLKDLIKTCSEIPLKVRVVPNADGVTVQADVATVQAAHMHAQALEDLDLDCVIPLLLDW